MIFDLKQLIRVSNDDPTTAKTIDPQSDILYVNPSMDIDHWYNLFGFTKKSQWILLYEHDKDCGRKCPTCKTPTPFLFHEEPKIHVYMCSKCDTIVTNGNFCFMYQGMDNFYKGKMDVPFCTHSTLQYSLNQCDSRLLSSFVSDWHTRFLSTNISEKSHTLLGNHDGSLTRDDTSHCTMYSDMTGFYYQGPVHFGKRITFEIKNKKRDSVDQEKSKQYYINTSLVTLKYNYYFISLTDWKMMVFPRRDNIIKYIKSFLQLFNGHVVDLQNLSYLLHTVDDCDCKCCKKQYKFSNTTDKLLLVGLRSDKAKEFEYFIENNSFMICNNNNSCNLHVNESTNFERESIAILRIVANTSDLLSDVKKYQTFNNGKPSKEWEHSYMFDAFLQRNILEPEYNNCISYDYLNDFTKWSSYTFLPIFLKPSGLYCDNFAKFVKLVKKFGMQVEAMAFDHQIDRVEDIGSTLYKINDVQHDENGQIVKKPWKNEWFTYLCSGYSAHVLFKLNLSEHVQDLFTLDCTACSTECIHSKVMYDSDNARHVQLSIKDLSQPYCVHDFVKERSQNQSFYFFKWLSRSAFAKLTQFKEELRNEVDIIWTRNPIHTPINIQEYVVHLEFLKKRVEDDKHHIEIRFSSGHSSFYTRNELFFYSPFFSKFLQNDGIFKIYF